VAIGVRAAIPISPDQACAKSSKEPKMRTSPLESAFDVEFIGPQQRYIATAGIGNEVQWFLDRASRRAACGVRRRSGIGH
jgi:hypothetical protein